MAPTLEIKNLRVGIAGKRILRGVSLQVKQGEIHAIMGPNGSGKSTLAMAVMGHPAYAVTGGDIRFQGKSINDLPADERARRGLFLSFQYPREIPGVTVSSFLRQVLQVRQKAKLDLRKFMRLLDDKMRLLGIDPQFKGRFLNQGFSGGEKKRCEILQLALIRPKIAVLDETDSGLDIDALKTVAESITKVAGKDMGVILITHYQRILRYVRPDKVHVMMDGRIIRSGGRELAQKLEKQGYGWLRKEA